MAKKGAYQVLPTPRFRRLTIDGGRLGKRKHTVYGLFEVDVTVPRAIIQEHYNWTGEKISFTSFLIHCLAQAVARNREVQGWRDWLGRIVIYDDVDVLTVIESEDEQGRRLPFAHVIRAADRKSLLDIHHEIRRCQAGPGGDGDFTPRKRALNFFLSLPGPLRRLIYRIIGQNPHLSQQTGGSVLVTALGMMGHMGGWGIVSPNHPLAAVIGGIASKPGVVGGRIEPREYLSVTLCFDHDVVDGGPATRLAQDFADLVESACGLEPFSTTVLETVHWPEVQTIR
jgi:pyruvate/2-oxoglutarate dehydrogenase complex dihydrolipoamide acyltransferase (E2) component